MISEELLSRIIPIVLVSILTLLPFCLLISFKQIVSIFKKIPRSSWLILLSILIAAFIIRWGYIQNSHYILFDEDIYTNIAQNIKNEGKACNCLYGTPTHCFTCIPDKEPYGLPAFHAVFFSLFGVSETVAHSVSLGITIASIALVFLLSYLLFKNDKTALYSALLMALTPIHIIWSKTQSADLLLLFFSLATMVLLVMYLEKRTTVLLMAFFLSLAYTCQIRPESLLFIIVAFFVFICFDKNLLQTIKKPTFLIVLTVFFLLILPTLIHTNTMKSDSWGAINGAKFSITYIKNNLRDNLGFFFDNTRFPLAFTSMALIGFVFGLLMHFKKIIPFIVWFLIFFSIYIPFYAGSFNYGADVRFSLILYPPIALLAGFGVFVVSTVVKQKKKHVPVFVFAGLCGAIILFFLQFFPFVKSSGSSTFEEAWDARASHDFAVSTAKDIKQCVVISQVPQMFLVSGVAAVENSVAYDPLTMEELQKTYPCILFYEDYWCVNAERMKNTICLASMNDYGVKKYKDITIRDKTFSFYSVDPAEAILHIDKIKLKKLEDDWDDINPQ